MKQAAAAAEEQTWGWNLFIRVMLHVIGAIVHVRILMAIVEIFGEAPAICLMILAKKSKIYF